MLIYESCFIVEYVISRGSPVSPAEPTCHQCLNSFLFGLIAPVDRWIKDQRIIDSLDRPRQLLAIAPYSASLSDLFLTIPATGS